MRPTASAPERHDLPRPGPARRPRLASSSAPARGDHVPAPGLVPAVAVLAVALLTCFPAPGLPNPFDNFGLGSRSTAMGCAMTAVADDFSGSLYNPAGLVDAGRTEISIGYFFANPELETYWADQWWDINEDNVSGIVLGMVSAPIKVLGMKLAGGLGLHLPDKRVARSLLLPYDQPRFLMFSGQNQRTVVYSPYSLQITPWLSLGAGFQMFIDTSGGPDFELIEETQANRGKYSEGTISSTQKPRFFPFAGILVKPLKNLRLGFAFRDKQEITLDIPLIIKIQALTLGFGTFPLLPASTIDLDTPAALFFSPRQYALGVAWRPLGRLLVAMDVTYMQWSEHRNPSPEGRGFYTGGLAALLRQPSIFRLPQGGLRDIWVPAIGAEYRAFEARHLEVFLRLGYRYRHSPVPEQTGRTLFLDSNTHILSSGFGLTFRDLFDRIMREPFSVDVHGQLFVLEQRDYVRDLLVAISDRYGDVRFRGRVWNLGITTTFRF